MTKVDKRLLQAALAMHDQLSQQGPRPETIYLPEYSWEHCQRLKRRIHQARRRGWHLAADNLLGELADTCRRLQREMETAVRGLTTLTLPRLPSSASTIYLDLAALNREFAGVEVDLEKHELTVTTDAIELEGVSLGDFEIRLQWDQIGQVSQPYRVVALDPNPAARRDDVTHPHVQDEQLCEGDGRSAIAAALPQRRFYDFFVLVDQILHNYGQGSAYVELSNWHGVPCDDCGTNLSEDDRYSCSSCDSTLCESCSPSCQSCGNTYCSNCLQQCAACGQDYCSSCLEVCPICRKRFCADCRQEELCVTCYEKTHEEETEDDPSDDSPSEEACLAGEGCAQHVH